MSRVAGRGNRRRRRKGTVRRRVWRGAVVVSLLGALVAAVGWAGPRAWRAVRTHEYFALEHVVIHKRGRTSERAIHQAMHLRLGMSIWDVDAARLETEIERLPWVRSARVRRELPRRVVVRVRAHRPAAIIHLAGLPQPLHYVSATGHVFAPVGTRDGRDLPYVTGLDRDAVESGAAEPTLRAALAALRTAARHRDALGAISEVHLDVAAGLTLLPVRPPVPILVGWEDVDAKLARIAEVLPSWLAREDAVRSVRGTLDEQVIVRLRAVPKGWGT